MVITTQLIERAITHLKNRGGKVRVGDARMSGRGGDADDPLSPAVVSRLASLGLATRERADGAAGSSWTISLTQKADEILEAGTKRKAKPKAEKAAVEKKKPVRKKEG